VTARCHRAINTKCFGNNDDGIDTLQQLISFKSREDSPVHGVWRGTNDGESDSFDIEIHRLYRRGQFGDTFYYGSRFTGLLKGQNTWADNKNLGVRWFECYFFEEHGTDLKRFTARISGNDKMTINYETKKGEKRVFTAIKKEP
jgi:hypothetical protein